MLPYIGVFIIIYILSMILEKGKDDKRFFVFISTIIVLILAIFAGIRDDTIGTDVNVYIKPIVNALNNYSFFMVYDTANVEILFVVLAWFSNLINNNLITFLMIIQIVINVVIMYIAYANRDKISISNFMLVYLTVFLGISFNLARQSIAIAFMMLAYVFLEKKDYKKYFLTMIIAIGFHISAIVGFLIFIIYTINNSNIKTFIKYIIVSSLVLGIFFFKEIIMMGLDIGLLPVKFEIYVTKLLLNEIDIQLITNIVKVFLGIICFLICMKDVNNNPKHISTMKFFIIIDFLLFQLGAQIKYMERLSYYYSILIYLWVLPRGGEIIKYKNVYNFGIFIVMFFYWWITFDYLKISSIIPYTSEVYYQIINM